MASRKAEGEVEQIGEPIDVVTLQHDLQVMRDANEQLIKEANQQNEVIAKLRAQLDAGVPPAEVVENPATLKEVLELRKFAAELEGKLAEVGCENFGAETKRKTRVSRAIEKVILASGPCDGSPTCPAAAAAILDDVRGSLEAVLRLV